jgi:hypothetical protein
MVNKIGVLDEKEMKKQAIHDMNAQYRIASL